MVGETISQWLSSLSVLWTVAWLIGLGILYTTGINLSRRKGRWWLSISFIGVLMSWQYQSAYIYSEGLSGAITVIPVIIVATLIIAMIAWGNPQKAKSK